MAMCDREEGAQTRQRGRPPPGEVEGPPCGKRGAGGRQQLAAEIANLSGTSSWVTRQALPKCSSCKSILGSAFQVDHTTPLWKGGEDDISNATAMCPSCHAQKTQREEIEQADAARERRVREAEAAAKAFEETVILT